jgi:hypothetical protein
LVLPVLDPIGIHKNATVAWKLGDQRVSQAGKMPA